MPPAFTQTDYFVNSRPVYMRIQEHHCTSPGTPYLFADVDDHGSIDDVWYEGSKTYSMYETYILGKKSSHSPDRWVVPCIQRAERVERRMMRRIKRQEMECQLEDEKSRRLHLEQDFEEMSLEDPKEVGMGCDDEVEMGCEEEDEMGSHEPEDEGSYGSEVSVESEVESEDEDGGRPCDGVCDIIFTGKCRLILDTVKPGTHSNIMAASILMTAQGQAQ
ncbi:hypothetical protein JAAARDRAFT_76428, partial [Jaapia argillacea MUCL 33604]